MNKIIGIIGLIVSLIVQGFSASDSLTHEIAMAFLFVFLIIYNFEHAKDFSNCLRSNLYSSNARYLSTPFLYR